jgi:hypothetical protein
VENAFKQEFTERYEATGTIARTGYTAGGPVYAVAPGPFGGSPEEESASHPYGFTESELRALCRAQEGEGFRGTGDPNLQHTADRLSGEWSKTFVLIEEALLDGDLCPERETVSIRTEPAREPTQASSAGSTVLPPPVRPPQPRTTVGGTAVSREDLRRLAEQSANVPAQSSSTSGEPVTPPQEEQRKILCRILKRFGEELSEEELRAVASDLVARWTVEPAVILALLRNPDLCGGEDLTASGELLAESGGGTVRGDASETPAQSVLPVILLLLALLLGITLLSVLLHRNGAGGEPPGGRRE